MTDVAPKTDVERPVVAGTVPSRDEALEARIIAGTTTRADVVRLVESLEALAAERDQLRSLLLRAEEIEALPCYCDETSTRNCPRHGQGDA